MIDAFERAERELDPARRRAIQHRDHVRIGMDTLAIDAEQHIAREFALRFREVAPHNLAEALEIAAALDNRLEDEPGKLQTRLLNDIVQPLRTVTENALEAALAAATARFETDPEAAYGAQSILDVEFVWRPESTVRAAQVNAGEAQIEPHAR